MLLKLSGILKRCLEMITELNNPSRLLYKNVEGEYIYSRFHAVCNFEQIVKIQKIYYFIKEK